MESLETARTILREVADYENVQPEDLPPLEDQAPLDVWHTLVDGGADRSESLHFSYLWYQITIQPSGEIFVEP